MPHTQNSYLARKTTVSHQKYAAKPRIYIDFSQTKECGFPAHGKADYIQYGQTT